MTIKIDLLMVKLENICIFEWKEFEGKEIIIIIIIIIIINTPPVQSPNDLKNRKENLYFELNLRFELCFFTPIKMFFHKPHTTSASAIIHNLGKVN